MSQEKPPVPSGRRRGGLLPNARDIKAWEEGGGRGLRGFLRRTIRAYLRWNRALLLDPWIRYRRVDGHDRAPPHRGEAEGPPGDAPCGAAHRDRWVPVRATQSGIRSLGPRRGAGQGDRTRLAARARVARNPRRGVP